MESNKFYSMQKENDVDVTLETINAILTRVDKPLKSDYSRVIQDSYNVEITPIDFENTTNAVNIINNRISNATKGRIANFVREGTQNKISGSYFRFY